MNVSHRGEDMVARALLSIWVGVALGGAMLLFTTLSVDSDRPPAEPYRTLTYASIAATMLWSAAVLWRHRAKGMRDGA